MPPPAPTPVAAAAAPAAPGGALAGIARVALRIRHTAPGRVLYSLAPKSLLDALKARLPG
jgi:hypothetical protein